MKKVEITEFNFEHLDLFAWREADRKAYSIGSEFQLSLIRAEEKGQCWTAIYDGRIVCIGGVIPHTKKTGYCFTLFSEYADTAKIGTAKLVRRMFEGIIEDMDLHRLTTYNRIGAHEHDRWCEWLGFVREGVAKKFDDEGNDYTQFALLR